MPALARPRRPLRPHNPRARAARASPAAAAVRSAGCAAGARRRRGSCAGAATIPSTFAAISLKEPVSRRSSGGPVPSSARAAIRPVAISCAARSRSRTGRRIQRVRPRGEQRAADHRDQLAEASTSQARATERRRRSVGEIVTTARHVAAVDHRLRDHERRPGPGPDRVRRLAVVAAQRDRGEPADRRVCGSASRPGARRRGRGRCGRAPRRRSRRPPRSGRAWPPAPSGRPAAGRPGRSGWRR